MYYRKLIERTGTEPLGRKGRRELFSEVLPWGILLLDSMRVNKVLKDSLKWVNLALKSTDQGSKISRLKKELDQQKRSHAGDIKIRRREYRALDERSQDLEKEREKLKRIIKKLTEGINTDRKEQGEEEIYIPGIDLNYGKDQGTCYDNWRYNKEIFNGGHKFIVIRVAGYTIGHLKLSGEKTFYSYVNSVDENGRKVLKKFGIYSLKGYSVIADNIRVEDDNHIYVCEMKNASFNFLRKSGSKYNKDLVAGQLERITGKEEKVFVMDIN